MRTTPRNAPRWRSCYSATVPLSAILASLMILAASGCATQATQSGAVVVQPNEQLRETKQQLDWEIQGAANRVTSEIENVANDLGGINSLVKTIFLGMGGLVVLNWGSHRFENWRQTRRLNGGTSSSAEPRVGAASGGG